MDQTGLICGFKTTAGSSNMGMSLNMHDPSRQYSCLLWGPRFGFVPSLCQVKGILTRMLQMARKIQLVRGKGNLQPVTPAKRQRLKYERIQPKELASKLAVSKPASKMPSYIRSCRNRDFDTSQAWPARI